MVKTITAKMPHKRGTGFEMKMTNVKPKRNYGDVLLNLFGFIGDIALKR
jgi:hypothetical protein